MVTLWAAFPCEPLFAARVRVLATDSYRRGRLCACGRIVGCRWRLYVLLLVSSLCAFPQRQSCMLVLRVSIQLMRLRL